MNIITNKVKQLERMLKDDAPKVTALIKNILTVEQGGINRPRTLGVHWVYVHHNDSMLFDDEMTGGLLANSFNFVGFHVFHFGMIHKAIQVENKTVPYIKMIRSINDILNYPNGEKISVEIMKYLRLIFKSKSTNELQSKKCQWNDDNDNFEIRYRKFSMFMIYVLGSECWNQRRVVFFTYQLYTDENNKNKSSAQKTKDRITDEYREILHKIAQSHFNKDGRIFSIAVGDSKYRTGFSLYNVNSIHVLEAPKNYGDLLQSIARGVRMCGDYRLLAGEKPESNKKIVEKLSQIAPSIFTYIYDVNVGTKSREVKILKKYQKQKSEFEALNTLLKNQSQKTISDIMGPDKNQFDTLSPMPNYDNQIDMRSFLLAPDGTPKFFQILNNIISKNTKDLRNFFNNLAVVEPSSIVAQIIPDYLFEVLKKRSEQRNQESPNKFNQSNENDNSSSLSSNTRNERFDPQRVVNN